MERDEVLRNFPVSCFSGGPGAYRSVRRIGDHAMQFVKTSVIPQLMSSLGPDHMSGKPAPPEDACQVFYT